MTIAIRPFSSHLDELQYDEAAATLTVRYQNGSVTTYQDVPPDVAAKVLDSRNPSYGQALHMHIRGKYDFITHRGAPTAEGGATR